MSQTEVDALLLPHLEGLGMVVCDDCRQAYDEPPYYTFDADGCQIIEVDAAGQDVEVPHACTENMCPECAGPYLEPDQAGDPRRPEE